MLKKKKIMQHFTKQTVHKQSHFQTLNYWEAT